MNWQPIGECPIPKEGEVGQRYLLAGLDSLGRDEWDEGTRRWDGSVQQLFGRIAVVTHFCVVTPPEGMKP